MFYKREDIKKRSRYNDIAEAELKENASAVILQCISPCPHDHGWDHDVCCDFPEGNRTEKRWCRCLVNYTRETNKTCEGCIMKRDYAKPVENARFTDFEVPASNSGGDHIGEIDIILEFNGKEYCTEVKPQWNDESLLRMISEIITYCYVRKETRNKAIMFTKNSEQYCQWTGIKNGKPYPHAARKRIKEIIEENEITVFCIEDKGDRYVIEKLN